MKNFIIAVGALSAVVVVGGVVLLWNSIPEIVVPQKNYIY